MAFRKQIFSLLSFLSVAIILVSFQTTSVNALSVESHQYHSRNFHHHDVLAKKKRSTKQKRCKSRPTPSSASAPAPSKSPAAVAAPHSSAPAVHSSAAPAPAPPPPSPSPKPQQSSASPPPPQSTPSSSSVAQRLQEKFPQKHLIAYAGSPDQLSKWKRADAYYNWNVQPSGSDGPPFIPMLWGTKNQGSWQSNVLDASSAPNIVMTYNEPELGAPQANLSPQDAAGFWDAHVSSLVGKGTLIGCPAVTSDAGAVPWLDTFFSSCNNGQQFCGCDYMDLHCYATDAQDCINYFESMHQKYPMQQVISEFACQSFTGGPPCDASQVQAFAEAMVSFFKNTDYISAYAAFGVMLDLGNVSPTNGLMNSDGSPNQLAQIYYPGI